MNLFFRLFCVYVSALFRPKMDVLDNSVIRLRVYPNDLDVNAHVNNGRYMTLMDLGRFDLIQRTQLGKIAKQKQWMPLVASVSIKYKKSLKLFQAFEIHTKIVAWDSRWFYLDQKFMIGGKVYAKAWVRGLFYGADGRIPTQEVLDSLENKKPAFFRL